MSIKNRLYIALALLVLLASSVGATEANRLSQLKQFSPAVLSLNERVAEAEFSVEAFGERFLVELTLNEALWSRLTPARQAEAIGGGRNAFYQGKIVGVPSSWARINRIGNAVSGMFSDGEQLYLIDQAGAFILPQGSEVSPESTIVFRLSDLVADWQFDDGGLHHHDQSEFQASAHAPISDASRLNDRQAATYMVPVTIVTDTQFTATHGGNTTAVVLARMNMVDGFYSSQVGTGILLWHHEILSNNGPLVSTSAGAMLSEFRDFMSTGPGSGIPFEGQAHLMTGRSISDAAGIAFVNVTCNTNAGVGVNQNLSGNTISALVVAHELGHNFSAGHDDDLDDCPAGTPAGIMNSLISSNNQTFSQCSLDAIIPKLENAACLQLSPGIIFQDRFQ